MIKRCIIKMFCTKLEAELKQSIADNTELILDFKAGIPFLSRASCAAGGPEDYEQAWQDGNSRCQ